MRRIAALIVFAAVAGCGEPRTPVVSGGVVACYDDPDGPSHLLAGSVEIPAELRTTIDATFTPQLLIGVQAETAFPGRGKIVGTTFHFRGSISPKEYSSTLGLLPKDPRVTVEGRNARGDRVRIVARLEYRGRLRPDESLKVWD